jgi:hypothetical protein
MIHFVSAGPVCCLSLLKGREKGEGLAYYRQKQQDPSPQSSPLEQGEVELRRVEFAPH